MMMMVKWMCLFMFTGWWGQRTIVTWTSKPFDETFEVLYKPDSMAWRCIRNNQILILKQAVQAEAERDLSSAETLRWIITFPLIWSRFGPKSFSPNDVITSVFFVRWISMHLRQFPKWISRKVFQTTVPISNCYNWTGSLNMIQFSLKKWDLAMQLLWVNDERWTCDLTNEPVDMLTYELFARTWTRFTRLMNCMYMNALYSSRHQWLIFNIIHSDLGSFLFETLVPPYKINLRHRGDCGFGAYGIWTPSHCLFCIDMGLRARWKTFSFGAFFLWRWKREETETGGF